jgi:DNA-binding response OmpR family regulator
MRIAVLDEDPTQLELIQQTLGAADHDCHGYKDTKALLRGLRRESFDLLVIDAKSPDYVALETMRWARVNLLDRLPVLYISERTSEADIVEALVCGADSLMSKPIRAGELRARVDALLRRSYQRSAAESEFVHGRYHFDLTLAVASVDGSAVTLKRREFDLALFMFRNIGRLLSRQHVLEAVWNGEVEVSSRSLDTHVCRLRTKLGLTPDNGFKLAAVYGVGYRLEAVTRPTEATSATV